MVALCEVESRGGTLLWAEHLPKHKDNSVHHIPVVDEAYYDFVLPDYRVWDQTPVLDSQGQQAIISGKALWLFLCAPKTLVGDERHFHNRLRLVFRENNQWVDAGFLLPEQFSLGSREWAGVAYLHGSELTLYHTAAGDRNGKQPLFLQRVYKATATLRYAHDTFVCEHWQDQGEVLLPDSRWYDDSGKPARFEHAIKAFRDPFCFRDANGQKAMLVAATKSESEHHRDACIGLALYCHQTGVWEMTAPILDAQGVTYEVERPHSVWYQNQLYVFWSVHGWTTAAEHALPTGLYGMVGPSSRGPFTLLNDVGLVASNPPESPYQAYSWFVCGDLSVSSFIDLPDGKLIKQLDFAKPAGHFVGAMAPPFRLSLNGDKALPIFD